MGIRRTLAVAAVGLAAVAMLAAPHLSVGARQEAKAAGAPKYGPMSPLERMQKRPTKAQRFATAARVAKLRNEAPLSLSRILGDIQRAYIGPKALNPLGTPDYFNTPNYANSPLPLDGTGAYATTLSAVATGTGMRKFVDSLPGIGPGNANDLGQYIPVASPNTTAYPGDDYYVIALVEYTKQMHADLPPTRLRGYVQLNPDTLVQVGTPQYLGPMIVAQRDKAVRVKFINRLSTGSGGNLFLPVDTTLMGAGMGPDGVNMYTQNRATLHLHGGYTPWISDGTPHQWTTPANESTPYQEGVSVRAVPDMDGGNEPTGTLTFYYTNQQSARLMFYHDHAYGITRLNVYAGEAAPYLVEDPVEQTLVNGGDIRANGTTVTVAASTIPTEQIPMVIQDKSFVPTDSQLATQDPTWDKAGWGGYGQLWFPHVYMPNQNPSDPSGVAMMGRWDYAPWFYPPTPGIANGPVANPLAGQPGQNDMNPGTPNPTIVPEAFMDTPLVNGTAYPYVKVARKAYRFRILNASNDRMLNLQMYYAVSNTPASVDVSGNPTLQTDSGEVPMVPACSARPATWPATWPKDGRDGGVPDPGAAGPEFIQIGNEGGFLPSATVIPNQPVGYEYFRRTVTVLNVKEKSLLLGPAERADVIVDFSQVPDGSKIILYNDSPAPIPGFDSRLDYYTGDGDQTAIGGAPNTLPGYGPNTRTVMQFQVGGATAAPAFDLTSCQTGLEAAYAASQDKPIVPQAAFNAVYGASYPDQNVRAIDTTIGFVPVSGTTTVTKDIEEKLVVEGFDLDYGRMNAQLGGVDITLPKPQPPGTAAPWYYRDIPTEVITDTPAATKIGDLKDGTQIWRLDHAGVDTHVIHFHMFNVQVLCRTAIDGQIFPTDPNEVGWKESVRVNPLTETFVAIRAVTPKIPFKLGDSVRPLDPTLPLGATASRSTIVFGQTITFTFTNAIQNYGWEYVWHCHILGHEENDMMRPLVIVASPAAPTTLTATAAPLSTSPPTIRLAWSNNWTNPEATATIVERATDAGFTAGLTEFSLTATATSLADTSCAPVTRYYYRVRAENSKAYSPWSNTATAVSRGQLPKRPSAPTLSSRTRTILRFFWTYGAAGLTPTSVRIQTAPRSTGPWTTRKTLSGAPTSSYLSGLTPFTVYYVRIQAVGTYGTSTGPATWMRTSL